MGVIDDQAVVGLHYHKMYQPKYPKFWGVSRSGPNVTSGFGFIPKATMRGGITASHAPEAL